MRHEAQASEHRVDVLPYREFLIRANENTHRPLHAVIAMVRRHRLVPVAQEGDILVAPDEAHVRAGFDEGVRIGDGALGDEVRPELARPRG